MPTAAARFGHRAQRGSVTPVRSPEMLTQFRQQVSLLPSDRITSHANDGTGARHFLLVKQLPREAEAARDGDLLAR